MTDRIKKIVFYFNGAFLSLSYLFLSTVLGALSIFSTPNVTEQTEQLLPSALKSVLKLILDFARSGAGLIIYFIAIALPIIIAILTVMFLKNDLSKQTFNLLSFSFLLPLIIFICEVNNFTGYVYFSTVSIALLIYLIVTLAFMHKDNEKLN